MDISNNQKLDLLYLTNPSFMNKYNKTPEINSLDKTELKFYRKRILLLTKEYLRGHKENNTIDNVFDSYAYNLINYFKFNDKKDIIQENYKDIKKKKKKVNKNFKLMDEDKKLVHQKKEETKTIKDYLPIVIKGKTKKKIIIPKKQKFDIKNQKFRTKKNC